MKLTSLIKFSIFFPVMFIISGCQMQHPYCNDSLGCIIVPPFQSIQIGFLLELSNPNCPQATQVMTAIQDWQEEAGNYHGHPISFIVEDLGISNSIISAAEELIDNQNVVLIIGPVCSTEAEHAWQRISDAGGIVVSLTSVCDELNLTGLRSSSEGQNEMIRAVNTLDDFITILPNVVQEGFPGLIIIPRLELRENWINTCSSL